MISNSNNSVDDIINNLSPIEKSILYECGKINASVNKNVSEDTLKKKYIRTSWILPCCALKTLFRKRPVTKKN